MVNNIINSYKNKNVNFNEPIEPEFHTWDTWRLLKLKELGKMTKQQWATAMGISYKWELNRLIKNNTDKIKIIKVSKKEIYYEIKEGIELK